jgi:hypothetical protein
MQWHHATLQAAYGMQVPPVNAYASMIEQFAAIVTALFVLINRIN